MIMGIANTLLIAIFGRRQESGLLRALGLLRGQIVGIVAAATLAAGLLAAYLPAHQASQMDVLEALHYE